VVIKPSNFDPNRKYPVIENIYAGPHDSFVPHGFRPFFNMHRLAELGFIVVQIDGMGTNNRGKAFHDVCWKNVADAGFPDRILWMQALAKKMPQADISRVGIYGTSAGGQSSTGGVLFHPEFYKVAVSACGCHDNRIDKQWWNEQWMGYPVGPHYAAQSNITNASNLKGHLLLIVGEQDRNVPPETTFRLADALIKSQKEFDFVVIPGADHTDGGPYGERKRRDFFVRWLHGVEPPRSND
jgi:dipeptidyl aminopeptidase/acylaminoacyl peptidase